MSAHQDRLQRCFLLVFTGLSANEIHDASVANITDWDSIANINLLCLIEEEFGIEIAAPDLERLTSFPLILQYLETRHAERVVVR
jgi:acyl carrier protein